MDLKLLTKDDDKIIDRATQVSVLTAQGKDIFRESCSSPSASICVDLKGRALNYYCKLRNLPA